MLVVIPLFPVCTELLMVYGKLSVTINNYSPKSGYDQIFSQRETPYGLILVSNHLPHILGGRLQEVQL